MTLAEGEISELHVGLKGTMNALFLKDLAAKTRRGLEGRVRAGPVRRGLCYGYDVVREHDARGEPIHGGRRINEAEAEIVRRIFREFAAGKSPRAIARDLNADRHRRPARPALERHHHPRPYPARHRHPAQRALCRPAGLEPAALRQGPRRRAGGSPGSTRSPPGSSPRCRSCASSTRRSGSRSQARLGVDPAIAARRQGAGRRVLEASPGAASADRPGPLRGLRRPLAAGGKDYLACATARRQGTCTNKRSIRRQVLEALILDGLKDRLMAPELVKEFIAEFHREVNRQQPHREVDLGLQRRELDEVNRKLRGLIEAIADGLRAPGLQAEARRARAAQDGARGRAGRGTASGAAPPPQPGRGLPAEGRRSADGACRPGTQTEALEILRGLIERVVLQPAEKGFEIELVGEIAAMVDLGAQNKKAGPEGSAVPDVYRCSVKVVAGARNHLDLLLTTRGPTGPSLSTRSISRERNHLYRTATRWPRGTTTNSNCDL